MTVENDAKSGSQGSVESTDKSDYPTADENTLQDLTYLPYRDLPNGLPK